MKTPVVFIFMAAFAASIIENASATKCISLNLAQNDSNQAFAGGSNIGPLATDSANWNNTINRDSGTLDNGTMANLTDNNGNNIGANVAWSCSNVWFNGVGTADDEHKLATGYLDDNGDGVTVTFSNIPYKYYRVYGLLASDNDGGGPYTTLDFQINSNMWVFGGASTSTASAYGMITSNMVANGEYWTEITSASTRGNYWTIMAEGPTLTIKGQPRTDHERCSLTAVIIEQMDINEDQRMLGFNFRGTGTQPLLFTATAGATGCTQRCWNDIADYSYTSSVVRLDHVSDSFGRIVGTGNSKTNGLALEFNGIGFWNNSITNSEPNYRLMRGYMDSKNTSPQMPYVQIWNIPYNIYDIVIYVDGDDPAGHVCGAYWIESATEVLEGDGTNLTDLIYCEQIGNPHFDGTFTRVPLTSTDKNSPAPGNYIVFKNLHESNITIRAREEENVTRAPINAFQIIKVVPRGMIMILQ